MSKKTKIVTVIVVVVLVASAAYYFLSYKPKADAKKKLADATKEEIKNTPGATG